MTTTKPSSTSARAATWRTGANLRELAYYSPEYMQHIRPDMNLVESQLAALQGMKVKLVRFFACHRHADAQTSIARVRAVLDRLHHYGMQAIVCLDDSVSPEFAVPRSDPNFPRTSTGHLHKKYWHERGYATDYLPHIRAIVGALGDHPAVLIWELGNEYALHPRPYEPRDGEAFLKFAAAASETIKTLSPKKWVSTGLVNSRQVGPEADWEGFSRQLHGLPTIDAISIHYYDDDGEEAYAEVDVNVARALKKPFYVGEVGALAPRHGGTRNRAQFLRQEMREWRAKGAFAVLPWAFDTSPVDVGVSDAKSFARIFDDFDAICKVMGNLGEDAPPIVAGDASPDTQPTPKVTVVEDTGLFIAQSGPANPPPAASPATLTYEVVYQYGLNIREAPRRDARPVGHFNPGDRVALFAGTRTEFDGVVWWQHARGWSAEVDQRNNLLLLRAVAGV
jgi:hypothetical protein